jgi:hypothetical protein
VKSRNMLELRILIDRIATLNVTDTTCGAPIRDQTSLSILVPAVGMSITLVLIILRVYTRLVVANLDVDLDDWATIFLGVSLCAREYAVRSLPAKCHSVVRCQSTSVRSCVSDIGRPVSPKIHY